MKVILFAVVLTFCGVATQAQQALDMNQIPGGNALSNDPAVAAKADTFAKIDAKNVKSVQAHCNGNNLCTFYVYKCDGSQIILNGGVGQGANLSNGNSSAVNVYTDSGYNRGTSSLFSGTLIWFSNTNTVNIDESFYIMLKTYAQISSTKEFAMASMNQKDPTTSKDYELNLAFAKSLLGTQCTNGQSTINRN